MSLYTMAEIKKNGSLNQKREFICAYTMLAWLKDIAEDLGLNSKKIASAIQVFKNTGIMHKIGVKKRLL